ncbi:cilia- and flagella- associated protein 210-like [Branchiostoma lanceolatum]|uniref:cilia- and flagella- associated protein 210-like n=1 Tax=Branchiostoma lanceolatum TaxID=7740 RepID=UPI0034521C2D
MATRTMSKSAEVIRHGRRQGQARTPPPSGPPQAEGPQHTEFQVPGGTDLRDVMVMSKKDFERIHGTLTQGTMQNREAQKAQRIRQDKEALHSRSKDVVKNWANTIAGQRQKRLEARKIREDHEEAERVQVDIEEAKYQAEQRRKAIEKAKTQQYYQTDRVKGFHGALLLTEVLKERDAQVELKQAKERANQGKDRELLRKFQEDRERAILEDQMAASKRYQERATVANFQINQIQEHHQSLAGEEREDRREGQEIQRLARLHEWERRKLDDLRRQEKMELMMAHQEHTSNRDAIRAIEQQKEEEEDEEIRLFAAAKKKMTKLRRERESEMFKKVQDHRDKMVDLLSKQLKKKVDNEDERIAKAVTEQEAKMEADREEKEEKIKAELKSIAEHRAQVMAQEEQARREKERKDQEVLELKMEADKIFQAKQEDRQRKQLQDRKNLASTHLKQAGLQKEVLVKKKQEDLEYDRKNFDLIAVEEQQFQEYAGHVIKKAVDGGRNPYPLIKAASEGAGGGKGPLFDGKGGIRPSYMATDGQGTQLSAYQGPTTEDVKNLHIAPADKAKKRLGFVW